MEGNNIKSFENLCKIFEMRIKLDKEKKIKTPSDVLINYEKYAKKIDSIYNEEFEKEIRPLITPSKTIEEEKEKLEKLIKLLEDRLDKRNDLENRYYIATGDYISGLQVVISDKELDEKRQRLSLINRYLETNSEIDSVHNSIAKLKILLDEEEEKKEEYKTKNQIMEDALYTEFMKVIKENSSFNNITEDNVDDELNNIISIVKESKETLDVTRESVKNLITNGLEDDYTSYVDEAEKSYFVVKNKELYLKLYKLVINFEDDFNSIFVKRDNIKKLIEQRKDLRNDLGITDIDELLSFEKKILEQIDIINNEKKVLENISNYTSRIEFKESRLEELENDNNSVEILSILREFHLIDTYDNDDDVLDTVEQIVESKDDEDNKNDSEDSIVKEFIDPYRIKEVREAPLTLNLGLAKLKGEAVREKVNKKLNPKPISFDDVLSGDINVHSEKSNEDIKEPLVWELPKSNELNGLTGDLIDTNKNKEDGGSSVMNVVKEETPIWNIPSDAEALPNQSINNPIPLWENIQPKFNDVSNNMGNNNQELSSIDITSNNESSISNNNPFWIPVSDEKLETSSFPNINIPITDNLSSNDNFGFPDLNNN